AQQAAERLAGELRQAVQQERDKAEAAGRELAAVRRDTETRLAAMGKAVVTAGESQQAVERTANELRQTLQQERDKVHALAQDLAAARREMQTQKVAADKAGAPADDWQQAAERTATELRQALQQERDKTEALARELTA